MDSKKYKHGKVCRRNPEHGTVKYIPTGRCAECLQISIKLRREGGYFAAKMKELRRRKAVERGVAYREYKKDRNRPPKSKREIRPPKLKLTREQRVERQISRRKAYAKRYCAENRALKTYLSAKHRASKKKATPSWLTFGHKEDMKTIYARAKDLRDLSGEKVHVDHIVPIQGKNVCGLHVPWNLQLLYARDNHRKSNKM